MSEDAKAAPVKPPASLYCSKRSVRLADEPPRDDDSMECLTNWSVLAGDLVNADNIASSSRWSSSRSSFVRVEQAHPSAAWLKYVTRLYNASTTERASLPSAADVDLVYVAPALREPSILPRAAALAPRCPGTADQPYLGRVVQRRARRSGSSGGRSPCRASAGLR